jgi:predicted phosphatase
LDSTPVKDDVSLRIISYMLEDTGGRMLADEGRTKMEDLQKYVAPVGIGYVLSLFEWNAVKNAVKKST